MAVSTGTMWDIPDLLKTIKEITSDQEPSYANGGTLPLEDNSWFHQGLFGWDISINVEGYVLPRS